MRDEDEKRLRELKAAVAAKRKQQTEPFVKMPLWWAEAAAKATGSPVTILLVELLRLRWKMHSMTFPLPNGRLAKLGVSREIKRRALRELERARLITIERPPRKTPIITLILL